MGNLEIVPHRFVIKETHFTSPIFTNVSLFGVYADKIEKKTAHVEMTILIRAKNEELPVLMLTGDFILKSNEELDIPDSYVRLAQRGFDLIEEYVKTHGIQDVFHKPFIMPPFLYSKGHFSGIILD